MKTCIFFGQSINDSQDNYIAEILRLLEKEIGEQKAEILIGSIEGMVSTALLCGCIYRATHPNTKLIYLPITKNTPTWSKLLFDAVLFSSFEDETPEYAIDYRNHYLVDHCDVCITNFYDNDCTAFNLYLRAKNNGKTVYNLFECLIQ